LKRYIINIIGKKVFLRPKTAKVKIDVFTSKMDISCLPIFVDSDHLFHKRMKLKDKFRTIGLRRSGSFDWISNSDVVLNAWHGAVSVLKQVVVKV
jgi:hypothetical protein